MAVSLGSCSSCSRPACSTGVTFPSSWLLDCLIYYDRTPSLSGIRNPSPAASRTGRMLPVSPSGPNTHRAAGRKASEKMREAAIDTVRVTADGMAA